MPGIAHENTAALERLEEPFVRIERKRIDPLEADQLLPAAIANHGRRPVSAIGVKPEVFLRTEIGEIGEHVDRASVGGSSIRDDAKDAPSATVGANLHATSRAEADNAH